jgi:hypothetical protein
MVYRGHFRNGVIEFDEPVELADGTEVQIVPVGEEQLPTLYERFKDFIGVVEDLPADAAEQHDHYLYGTPKKP